MIHKFETDSVVLEFGERRILSDIYFKCETGKITGVLGRNGQGKSCLMNIAYGTFDALSKSVRFDGVAVHDAYKRPDLLLYLPQFHFIPASLTLKRIFSDFNLSYSDFAKHFPEFKGKYKTAIKNLSGGERRLVEVYAVITADAMFAMLDEPFSHLMPLQIEKVQELLLQAKARKGLLITDHMFQYVTEISDSIYILKDGKTHLIQNREEIETLGYARL